MTIDWLFIGFLLGFITTAWICPAVDRMFKKQCSRTAERLGWPTAAGRGMVRYETYPIQHRNGPRHSGRPQDGDAEKSVSDGAIQYT